MNGDNLGGMGKCLHTTISEVGFLDQMFVGLRELRPVQMYIRYQYKTYCQLCIACYNLLWTSMYEYRLCCTSPSLPAMPKG